MAAILRHAGRLQRATTVNEPEIGAPAAGDQVGTEKPPGGGFRSHLGSLAFLAPSAIWLLLIVGYPFIATVRNSFYGPLSKSFVGLDNYRSIFSTADILVAIRNNVIWVVVFPFLVTFLGLVFAVLTERIRWATAFKIIVFMPIVFSATASAMVWRAIFDLDPHVGMLNATLETVNDWFSPPGLYPVDTSAGQSVAGMAATGVTTGPGGTLLSQGTVSAGGTVKMGMTRVSVDTLSLLGAQAAVVPSASPGAITGLVWRDFSPSHPTQKGQVFPDEDGLPGLRLTLLKSDGSSAGSATTDVHGGFRFSGVGPGSYRVQVDSSNFSSGFTGVNWLAADSVTPTSGLNQTAQALLSIPLVDFALIIAYLWIWAGFAMVVIGAGLAALNREVLEAARIDGATEWQTFRRVTMPMLAPVLVVVFVTMVINVLKIFDIIYNMAPGASQSAANSLATELVNYASAQNPQFGLASGLAVILFILVIPAMIANLRRIKG